MKIVVLSGKGGTGKSSVVSSLAVSLRDRGLVLVDCDADCPNQHLLFTWKPARIVPLRLSKVAVVDASKCTSCGKCEAACRFGAIHSGGGAAKVSRFGCEGCGACVIACPSGAISLNAKLTGRLAIARSGDFPLVYGRLEPGESGSGRLVFEAKKAAEKEAERAGAGLILVDAPAGIGCPVVAAVTGCDHAIGVVEPTPAGMANLERALEVVRHFGIPFSVVLNKAGISQRHEKEIAARYGKLLIATIPYDEEVPRLLAGGVPPVNGRGGAARALKGLAKKVLRDIIAAGHLGAPRRIAGKNKEAR